MHKEDNGEPFVITIRDAHHVHIGGNGADATVRVADAERAAEVGASALRGLGRTVEIKKETRS